MAGHGSAPRRARLRVPLRLPLRVPLRVPLRGNLIEFIRFLGLIRDCKGLDVVVCRVWGIKIFAGIDRFCLRCRIQGLEDSREQS